jgi:hypothetical protein
MSTQETSSSNEASSQATSSQGSGTRVPEEVLNHYIDEYLQNIEGGMPAHQSYQSEYTIPASQRSDEERTDIITSQESQISWLVDRAVSLPDSQEESSSQTNSSQLSTNSIDFNLYRASKP